MVTCIILSKDRPAQLDLLLRSIKQNGDGLFDWVVLWNGERGDEEYDYVLWEPNRFCRDDTAGGDFEFFTNALLKDAHELVCFMCDDGILYRPVDPSPILAFSDPVADHLLCFSLRLGQNTTICYPSGLNNWHNFMGWMAGPPMPFMSWKWTEQPQEPGASDFGYPGSVDGHIFRTSDVKRMLTGKSFANPTELELALVAGCRELAHERPLMACFPHSVYVGNPINRVSLQSNVRFGTRFPVTAEECQRRFLAGERIDLDALDFSGVDGAHSEIQLVWKTGT